MSGPFPLGVPLEPYYEGQGVTLFHGDCREVLAELPDASVDSVVTDPPYELGFMGKRWDASGIAYDAGLWAEALRVLKPGGHLLAFGGTRTWHRLAVAIEDAGFEIRDSIAWMYGSGFPKSHNVAIGIDKAAGAMGHRGRRFENSGLRHQGIDVPNPTGIDAHTPATPDAARWQGWGTALKPAHEPIVVARKPLTGTVAANVLEHGTGALNIDGCRIETDEDTRRNASGGDNGLNNSGTFRIRERRAEDMVIKGGRWPANVVLDEDQAAALDGQSGSIPATRRVAKRNYTYDNSNAFMRHAHNLAEGDSLGYADSGGASRFFYVAKAPARERPKVDGVAHPTVKPLTLMRWLCRLVTPLGGIVLEPFAGSGTTVEAALLEGFRVVAIEREPDYLPLIAARLERIGQEPDGQLTLDASA